MICWRCGGPMGEAGLTICRACWWYRQWYDSDWGDEWGNTGPYELASVAEPSPWWDD